MPAPAICYARGNPSRRPSPTAQSWDLRQPRPPCRRTHPATANRRYSTPPDTSHPPPIRPVSRATPSPTLVISTATAHTSGGNKSVSPTGKIAHPPYPTEPDSSRDRQKTRSPRGTTRRQSQQSSTLGDGPQETPTTRSASPHTEEKIKQSTHTSTTPLTPQS